MQHLYEYKKAPLERFTFWQISSKLIFVHYWIVELGSVIKVKPGVIRGPLWLGARLLRDRVVLLFFPINAHVQNDMRWFSAVFAHRVTCSCFWMTARCSHVWCQPAFRLRRGIVNQTSIASDMFCSPKFLESHTQKHAICAKWVI